MRQTRTVQIALVIHEDLRFVNQATKGCAMNNAIAVALKLATVRVGLFCMQPAAALRLLCGVAGQTGIRVVRAHRRHARNPIACLMHELFTKKVHQFMLWVIRRNLCLTNGTQQHQPDLSGNNFFIQ